MSEQKRPYAMDTGWVRGISVDLDGEALYRWSQQLEAENAELSRGGIHWWRAMRTVAGVLGVDRLSNVLPAVERLRAERDGLRAYAKGLLPDVELAQLANGGKAFRQDWCQCDPSVGMAPCQYCAILDALERTERFLQKLLGEQT